MSIASFSLAERSVAESAKGDGKKRRPSAPRIAVAKRDEGATPEAR